jgi:starvation-inducible DNA-binding protein
MNLDRRCISLTQVKLPIGTKVRVIAILNQTLATIVDLKAQIKSVCWNVTGINCIGLPEIFTQMVDQIEEYTDIFALRITHLGRLASVTVHVAAEVSMLLQVA